LQKWITLARQLGAQATGTSTSSSGTTSTTTTTTTTTTPVPTQSPPASTPTHTAVPVSQAPAQEQASGVLASGNMGAAGTLAGAAVASVLPGWPAATTLYIQHDVVHWYNYQCPLPLFRQRWTMKRRANTPKNFTFWLLEFFFQLDPREKVRPTLSRSSTLHVVRLFFIVYALCNVTQSQNSPPYRMKKSTPGQKQPCRNCGPFCKGLAERMQPSISKSGAITAEQSTLQMYVIFCFVLCLY